MPLGSPVQARADLPFGAPPEVSQNTGQFRARDLPPPCRWTHDNDCEHRIDGRKRQRRHCPAWDESSIEE
ncbi:MAG: hypothetical protein QOF81_2889, partial [Acidimicrobiaceae bacterium]|nr:hypothetical protein [Acidimicrobiaceae bacterium]